MTKAISKSFRRGLRNARAGEVKSLKADIAEILGNCSRTTFIAYADGKRILDAVVAANIEAAFLKHGVPASEVWGE